MTTWLWSRLETNAPGALLRDDVIPATGRTKAEIAQLLGISRQHLYDILRERKPVSATTAVRVGNSVTVPELGSVCSPRTISGMPSARRMSIPTLRAKAA